jgi:hypothetical protein
MRALRLSCLLLTLSTAASAVERTPYYYDCGLRPLDLPCAHGQRPRRAWSIGPMDEHFADQAYVVRFGGSTERGSGPSWDVRLGNRLRQALFWAAVVTTFIL